MKKKKKKNRPNEAGWMHRWKEERMNERHWTAADGWTVGALGACAELTLRVESAGVCTDHHRSLDDGHIGVLPPAVNRHRVSLSLLLSYAINNSSTSSSAATAGHCRHHRHHRIATDRPLLAMHVVVWSRCDQWQGQEDRKRKKNCSSAWVDPIYSLEEEEERRASYSRCIVTHGTHRCAMLLLLLLLQFLFRQQFSKAEEKKGRKKERVFAWHRMASRATRW